MTLWFDRTGEIPPGEPATHALVIGVSRYRHLPPSGGEPSEDPLTFGLTQATTPATGAFRFAGWLRDGFRSPASLATVRLLLSPSQAELAADPELAAAAAQVEPACRSNVREALLAWKASCDQQPGGMALLYLSGHGISMSMSDPYVLLEDFAADENVMEYSVDVGGVHRGMAGPALPRTQFYFVDACRIRPAAFSKYRSAGSGVGLREEWDSEDRRAAPIYFSASPGTPALGEPGNGTLFSQALLDCLSGLGADDQTDEHGRFRITGFSLQQALEQRVADLAAAYGEVQEVVAGGQIRGAVLHYFERPPEFAVQVKLQPDEAMPVAWADLWDYDRAARVLQDRPFEANPVTWRLPAGLYSLDVTVRPDTPPLRSQLGLPVPVDPQRVLRPRTVVLA